MDHHYVPQFYLRRWAGSDGRIWRYQREPSGSIGEKPVWLKGTAYEPDLYGVSSGVEWETYDPNIIETDVFQPIDTAAANALTKLLTEGHELNDKERGDWALFIASLLYRHRTPIEDRDRAAPGAAAEVLEATLSRAGDAKSRARLAKILGEIDSVQMAKAAHRTLMVRAIRDPALTANIKSASWKVLTAHPDARSSRRIDRSS